MKAREILELYSDMLNNGASDNDISKMIVLRYTIDRLPVHARTKVLPRPHHVDELLLSRKVTTIQLVDRLIKMYKLQSRVDAQTSLVSKLSKEERGVLIKNTEDYFRSVLSS